MNLYNHYSFNRCNAIKKTQNKGSEKNIFQLKGLNNRQKYEAYILNSYNNTTDRNNIETNENSSDISFYNTSLKNQILSPEDEDDIYQLNQYDKENNEIMQKNNDDIDINYLTLKNMNKSNYLNDNSKNIKKENKKTLILDLDETLVHSSFQPMQLNRKIIKPDIYFKIFFNYKYHDIYVYKRPFLNKFLKEMNKIFKIFIFTASIKKYAKPLLNFLDDHNCFIKKFYRESCILSNGKFIKDLSLLKIKLNDVIILDNNPISYKYNKKNGVPIKSWHMDKNDKELLRIIPLLDFLSKVDDVRKYIPYIIENDEINYNKINLLIHTSNGNKQSYSLNKCNRQNCQNIRLNKKINYNIDEEMKVNYINNNALAINFREPPKNLIPKTSKNNCYSINKYKDDINKKNFKKKKGKSKSNSFSVINFNSDNNNEISKKVEDNYYFLNNIYNDKYYKSCNNFYITNNKYSFSINKDNIDRKKNSKKRKQIININSKIFNNDEWEISNKKINKNEFIKSKSKKIPYLRKNHNNICLNKKLNNTYNEQNIIINKKNCKFKNYLNRFNSYKNIKPYKNFESCENDYYCTINPMIRINEEIINFKKNNTIEALGKNSNSIRSIICYNSTNCSNTLNNNISPKTTINYENQIYNGNENNNCINSQFLINNPKHSGSKENSNKKLLLLNKQDNKMILKKNIHRLLSLNTKKNDLIKNSYHQKNNLGLTSRINNYNNINDNNLFSNYSLKKERINADKNCYIKKKMKLKKTLLNKKSITKENAKSFGQEEIYLNYRLGNNISSERNYKKIIF